MMPAVRVVSPVMITTKAKDGSSPTFKVEVERTSGPAGTTWWTYTIRSLSTPGHFFQARFKSMEGARLRPMALDHYDLAEFVAKGIPEAIFADVVKQSGMTLVSSVTESDKPYDPYAGDYDDEDRRSDAATKMWRRLERDGKAVYVETEDRFVYKP